MPRDRRPALLTPTQRMLVETLLTELAPTPTDLAIQAASVLAQSSCTCGCPSIDIVAAPRIATSVTASTPTTASDDDDVDLFAHSPDGGLYTVLSVRNAQLVELDCTSHGDTPPFPRELADLQGWTFSGERVGSSGRSDS